MPRLRTDVPRQDGEGSSVGRPQDTVAKTSAPRRTRDSDRRSGKKNPSPTARRRRSPSTPDLGRRLLVLLGVLGGIFLLAGFWTPWAGPRGTAWASYLLRTVGGSVLVPLLYGIYLGIAFLLHRTVEHPWAQIGGTVALTFSLMTILGLQSFGLYRLPPSWGKAGLWGTALATFLYKNLGAFGTVLAALGALLVAIMCYGSWGVVSSWWERAFRTKRSEGEMVPESPDADLRASKSSIIAAEETPEAPSGDPYWAFAGFEVPTAIASEEGLSPRFTPDASSEVDPRENIILRRGRSSKLLNAPEGPGIDVPASRGAEERPPANPPLSPPSPLGKPSALCPEGEAVMASGPTTEGEWSDDGFAIPLDVEPGKFPAPLDTLGPAEEDRSQDLSPELLAQGQRIIATLKEFSVEASLAETVTGPTVVQFRLQLAPGIKVSRISGLSNDLAVALPTPSLRVEAPIPGKPYVGIEIPSPHRRSVSLRSVIGAEVFLNTRATLPLPLGVTIDGRPLILPLEDMPHLLVAGTTGSGKSVFISSCLIGLTYLRRPEEIRLILIDPKQVEMALYERLPHTLAAPVTDPKKALHAFNWAIQEMERRYALFAQARVRHLQLYNAKVLPKDVLPHIVIVVDELADLMMTAPKEVEDAICRLAQKARATGIHLIIATQRPSVNVVTGLIKANVPARIAFTLPSQVDSRTIIDVAGAERLLGRGDMLLLTSRFPKPIRCQAAWIEEQYILEYISYLTKIFGDPDHLDITNKDGGEGGAEGLCQDPLLEEAIETVLETGMASSSGLQRRFRVGYTRAARMIDAMESLGIVGPQTSRGREILVDGERAEALLREAKGR